MEQVIGNGKSENEDVFEENCEDDSKATVNEDNGTERVDDASEDSEGNDKPTEIVPEEKALTTAEASTINLKEILGVGKAQKLTYSRRDLMNLSGNTSSKERPACLLKEFDGLNGRWDPETWIRLTSATPTSSNGSAGDFNYKQTVKDDKYQVDGLTLRPQRSFREGCHVSNNTSSSTGPRSLKSSSFNDGQITAGNRTVRTRASLRSRSDLNESESLKPSEEFEWERDGRRDRFKDGGGFRNDRGHGRRDFDSDYRENDRDFRDRPYQSIRNNFLARRSESYANHGSSHNNSRHNRMRSYSEHEEEPEWFSEGPTSQFDTIELGGFDDDKGDMSWMGKEIPTDDLDLKGLKNSKTSKDKKPATADKSPTAEAKPQVEEESKKDEKDPTSKTDEQIVKESNETSPEQPQETSSLGEKGSTSRFSQWFQKQNLENAGSRDSTPHEELEKLAELTAESGMDENHEKVLNQLGLNSLPNQLQDDDEQKANLLLQQQSLANRNKLPFRQENAESPPMNDYNGDALQKLVATIREKDKLKKEAEMLQQQQQQQQGLPNNQIDSIYSQLMQGTITSDDAIYRMGALEQSGQRIPSPEQLAAHTQNIFQKALLKKQLEKQKDVYKDKLRLMEQHRREEQLREAIRSVNEKMHESKQYQKNMAFTPTSVIRKMHESRNEKTEMFPPQQQNMMMNNPSSSDSIESATASLAAKLANITKKTTQQRPDAPVATNADSELLARIYQSAAMAQKQGGTKPTQEQWNAMSQQRQNDGQDMQRPNSFNQPLNSNKNFPDAPYQGNVSKDKRNLQNVKHPVNYHQHMQNLFGPQQQINNAADFYNNNMKHKDNDEHQEASDLRHQEVAQLTANVLSEAGISEEKLSSLTVEQQQQVIKIVQQRYHQLQRQKQLAYMKKREKEEAALRGEKNPNDDFGKKHSSDSGNESIVDDRKNFGEQHHRDKVNDIKAGVRSQANAVGVLNTNARTHQQIPHPMHNPSMIPPLGAVPNMFAPIPRGGTVVPAFIPPPHHPLVPPPNAMPLGGPHPAALLHVQQQMYAQQAAAHHQQRILAAALQQQQQQQQLQALQAQMLARKQHPQAAKSGEDGNFSNPLERWFGPEVLTQSQVPQMQKHPLMLSEVERMRPNAE